MADVINPFAGHKVTLDWAGHKALGLTGGTDYQSAANQPVIAAMSGTARAFGASELNAISITAPNGLVVSVRELKTHTGIFPRAVHQGEQIGTTGLFRAGQIRYPHIDANRPSDGQRVPFEQYVGSFAGGGSTPIDNTTKDMDMITRRLVRQDQTAGVYYAVNNLLSPVISPAHLAGIIADMHGLQGAGDPFLVNAGPAAFDTIIVADLRTAGILPATAADLSAVDWDPSDADLAKIAADTVTALQPSFAKVNANIDDTPAAPTHGTITFP